MVNKVQIKNPGAAVLIFNYKHRMGAEPTTEDQAHEVEQIVLNTVSLKSVSTSKTKSNPAGSFQINLAPTKNWVNTISPGSWCIILMSQDKIRSKNTKYFSPKVDEKSFKMLGRVESVRLASTKDQATGATVSEYIVTGTDWGDIFNNALYVDPRIRSKTDTKNPIGSAERAIYNKLFVGESGNESVLKNSTENIKAILSFWGRDNIVTTGNDNVYAADGRLEKTANKFRLPKEVANYMKFTDSGNSSSKAIAQILKVIPGKLKGKDTGGNFNSYYKEIDDGHSIIKVSTLLGTHTIWQIIMSNANTWINDIYPEIRWEGDTPNLALYNRVKPFCLRSEQELLSRNESEDSDNKTTKEDTLRELVSRFKNIRTHEIKGEDITLINVGTNWRDRYNFIEVNVASQTSPGRPDNPNMSTEAKRKNQIFDKTAIGRDGFKPLIINASYIPKGDTDSELDPFKVQAWKTINKEWFFNIHRMLNGSVTFSGQSKYIPVGDNILIDANVVFPGINANLDHINNPKRAYLLAHVEAISNNVSVSDTGARTFMTEIQFVRGIIVDSNGNRLSEDELMDENTNKVTPSQEVNKNVFGTSSGKDGNSDPDIQKLGHGGN